MTHVKEVRQIYSNQQQEEDEDDEVITMMQDACVQTSEAEEEDEVNLSQEEEEEIETLRCYSTNNNNDKASVARIVMKEDGGKKETTGTGNLSDGAASSDGGGQVIQSSLNHQRMLQPEGDDYKIVFISSGSESSNSKSGAGDWLVPEPSEPGGSTVTMAKSVAGSFDMADRQSTSRRTSSSAQGFIDESDWDFYTAQSPDPVGGVKSPSISRTMLLADDNVPIADYEDCWTMTSDPDTVDVDPPWTPSRSIASYPFSTLAPTKQPATSDVASVRSGDFEAEPYSSEYETIGHYLRRPPSLIDESTIPIWQVPAPTSSCSSSSEVNVAMRPWRHPSGGLFSRSDSKRSSGERSMEELHYRDHIMLAASASSAASTCSSANNNDHIISSLYSPDGLALPGFQQYRDQILNEIQAYTSRGDWNLDPPAYRHAPSPSASAYSARSHISESTRSASKTPSSFLAGPLLGKVNNTYRVRPTGSRNLVPASTKRWRQTMPDAVALAPIHLKSEERPPAAGPGAIDGDSHFHHRQQHNSSTTSCNLASATAVVGSNNNTTRENSVRPEEDDDDSEVVGRRSGRHLYNNEDNKVPDEQVKSNNTKTRFDKYVSAFSQSELSAGSSDAIEQAIHQHSSTTVTALNGHLLTKQQKPIKPLPVIQVAANIPHTAVAETPYSTIAQPFIDERVASPTWRTFGKTTVVNSRHHHHHHEDHSLVEFVDRISNCDALSSSGPVLDDAEDSRREERMADLHNSHQQQGDDELLTVVSPVQEQQQKGQGQEELPSAQQLEVVSCPEASVEPLTGLDSTPPPPSSSSFHSSGSSNSSRSSPLSSAGPTDDGEEVKLQSKKKKKFKGSTTTTTNDQEGGQDVTTKNSRFEVSPVKEIPEALTEEEDESGRRFRRLLSDSDTATSCDESGSTGGGFDTDTTQQTVVEGHNSAAYNDLRQFAIKQQQQKSASALDSDTDSSSSGTGKRRRPSPATGQYTSFVHISDQSVTISDDESRVTVTLPKPPTSPPSAMAGCVVEVPSSTWSSTPTVNNDGHEEEEEEEPNSCITISGNGVLTDHDLASSDDDTNTMTDQTLSTGSLSHHGATSSKLAKYFTYELESEFVDHPRRQPVVHRNQPRTSHSGSPDPYSTDQLELEVEEEQEQEESSLISTASFQADDEDEEPEQETLQYDSDPSETGGRLDSFEDGESVYSVESGASSGDEAYADQEEELRGYNRAIDFTLHTILEESCEESDGGERRSVRAGRDSRSQRKEPSELEKYFTQGLGNESDASKGPLRRATSFANEESEYSDTFSETSSSIYSESLEPSGGEEDDIDPVELASSRLEKYFRTNFLGMEAGGGVKDPPGADAPSSEGSDESVGSDSESNASPEQQRRRKVMKSRGLRQRSSVAGSDDEAAHSDSLSAGAEAADSIHIQHRSVSSSSEEEDDDGEGELEEIVMEKTDGQFDTIKRRKKKRTSGGGGTAAAVVAESSQSAVEKQMAIIEDQQQQVVVV